MNSLMRQMRPTVFATAALLWNAAYWGVEEAQPLEANDERVVRIDPSASLSCAPEAVVSMTFVASGKGIACTDTHGNLYVWRLDDGQRVLMHRNVGTIVASSSVGDELACGEVGAHLWTVSVKGSVPFASKAVLDGSQGKLIGELAYSGDGRRIAAGFGNGESSVWGDLENRPRLIISNIRDGQVLCVALSFNGKLLATGSGLVPIWDGIDDSPTFERKTSGVLEVTDLETGKSRVLSREFGQPFWSVQFSPDEKSIVATAGKDVALWDVHSGQLRFKCHGHQKTVFGVAFSPDGKMLASAGCDDMARLWDAINGRAIAVLKGHTNIVNTVRFAPDGKAVATSSLDGTVRIWRLADIAQQPQQK